MLSAESFPFDCGGWFAGYVVDAAVDAADFVDDSVGYDAKNCRKTRFSDRDNGCNLKVVMIL